MVLNDVDKEVTVNFCRYCMHMVKSHVILHAPFQFVLYSFLDFSSQNCWQSCHQTKQLADSKFTQGFQIKERCLTLEVSADCEMTLVHHFT